MPFDVALEKKERVKEIERLPPQAPEDRDLQEKK